MLENRCPRCGQFLQPGKSCNCYVKDFYAKVNYGVLSGNPSAIRKSENMVFKSSSADMPEEHQKGDGGAFK